MTAFIYVTVSKQSLVFNLPTQTSVVFGYICKNYFVTGQKVKTASLLSTFEMLYVYI
jgi:hypothetical protein